jgi:hypothetical protein
MPTRDISHDFHADAKEALCEMRASYGRYLDVVEAQRVALGQGNLRMVARLSERIDTIIADVQDRSNKLAPVYPTVSSRATDGPRAQELRDLMTAVAAEAALAQAAQQDLTKQMITRRDQVVHDLDQLDGLSARPNSPYSRQPTLVDASA